MIVRRYIHYPLLRAPTMPVYAQPLCKYDGQLIALASNQSYKGCCKNPLVAKQSQVDLARSAVAILSVLTDSLVICT